MTKEIKASRELGEAAGKWSRNKLDPEIFGPIHEFMSQVRKFHYDNTLCWRKGEQLLTPKLRQKYDAYMDEAKPTFMAFVEQFKERYQYAVCCWKCKKNPRLKGKPWNCCARGMHGPEFRPEDYPDVSQIADEFGMEIEHSPVPAQKHFANELQQVYGSELAAGNDKRMDGATQDAIEKLLKPIAHIVTKLTEKKVCFRDSLIENVNEMLGQIPAFDFAGSPKIAKAVSAIQKQIAGINPEALRDSKVLQKEIVVAAQKILATFGGGGRKLITD